jgi:hypothetical protein
VRFHHVSNGHCATGLIERSDVPGTTSVWADVLHDGPVPPDLSDDELLAVRAGFLAGEESVEAVAADLRQWRAAIDAVHAYDELVLWFEHDLFDQLNLIQLLGHIANRVAALRPVTMICVGSFPVRPRFRGLGELNASEIATLFPGRQPVDRRQYDCAARAWQAFRAADPREVEHLLAGDTSALPYLAPALQRHLEELPWTTDGLSRTERRLLQLVAARTSRVHDTFVRMHEAETAFFIADGSFWDVVQRLSTCARPLLDVAVKDGDGRALPDGTLSVTDDGRAVLDGRQDHVRLNGIDRWFGGAHLTPDCPYRWDQGTQRVGVGPHAP